MTTWQTQLNQLQQDHRVPMFLTAFFIVLLLTTVGNTLITLTAHHANIKVITKTSSIKPLANLADLHLFGVYSANLDNLPTTQLQLTLEGTVVSPDSPTQSYALIDAPNQLTKVYRIGDTLPGDATITRIKKHNVILNDNGMLEKLALPIQKLKETSLRVD